MKGKRSQTSFTASMRWCTVAVAFSAATSSNPDSTQSNISTEAVPVMLVSWRTSGMESGSWSIMTAQVVVVAVTARSSSSQMQSVDTRRAWSTLLMFSESEMA